MKSHELAKQLLALPDNEITIAESIVDNARGDDIETLAVVRAPDGTPNMAWPYCLVAVGGLE